MNPETLAPEILARLRDCCRDETAFEQLTQILTAVNASDRAAEVQQIEQHRTLFGVITRLRESLDLDTIFQTTAVEVRALLGADRVGMFRFFAESGFNDGEFVSESVDAAFDSALTHKVHDHCFGDQFAIHYQQGRVQAVADINDAGLSPCHRDILAQFQVRANLAVPLLLKGRLWGLLCIHQCATPRIWQPIEIDFVTQIAAHLGIALQHAELLNDLRAEITERQQAEAQTQLANQGLRNAVIELRAVNHELEAFSYSVSHDLRAPLRSVDGFSQALLEDYRDQLDDNAQDYLGRIRAATQRMGHLIDDLLTLSRVTRSDITRTSVDLSFLARGVCLDLQAKMPDRRAEFIIEPNLHVQGDARLLQVVLENLLHNAWKFSAQCSHTRIEFTTIESSDGVTTYCVRDNGVGFDMKYVHKLFAPFQRLHGMQEFPGNGIGLATVQRIVHRHAGRVWATATIGGGASFYFTLSAAEEEES